MANPTLETLKGMSEIKNKHIVTTPWKPARLLDIPEKYKDPKFTYRFVDKKVDGNLSKKENEGWEIDKELSKKVKQLQRTILDGSNLDGSLQIREMIVMKMPKEMVESRKKYFEDINSAKFRGVKKSLNNAANQITGDSIQDGVYGEVKIDNKEVEVNG